MVGKTGVAAMTAGFERGVEIVHRTGGILADHFVDLDVGIHEKQQVQFSDGLFSA